MHDPASLESPVDKTTTKLVDVERRPEANTGGEKVVEGDGFCGSSGQKQRPFRIQLLLVCVAIGGLVIIPFSRYSRRALAVVLSGKFVPPGLD